jgi:hypothetical protein
MKVRHEAVYFYQHGSKKNPSLVDPYGSPRPRDRRGCHGDHLIIRADDFVIGPNDAFFAAQNVGSALVYAPAASSASGQYVGESNGRGV